MILIAPVWLLVGLALCWIPALIGRAKGDPAWIWVVFGIVCLPLAVVFALLEKPIDQRKFSRA